MKKIVLAVAAALLITGCGNKKCQCNCKCAGCECSTDTAAAAQDYELKVADKKNVDIASFPKDKDGYIVLFDGKTLNGWRGYGMDNAPKARARARHMLLTVVTLFLRISSRTLRSNWNIR